MKIGIISDIHGNTGALHAALELLGDTDRLVCLGDAINQHRFSNEVVSILRERQIATIWGNHEALFFGRQGERARMAPWIDPELLEWLRDCPISMTLTLQSVTVLLVHSSPVTTPFSDYLVPGTPSFLQQFDYPAADIILCGHTHRPAQTLVGRTLVVNPGSTGEGRPVAAGFISSCAVLTLPSRQVDIRDFVPAHDTDASMPGRREYY